MEDKYYLGEQGLAALAQTLASIIKSHTSRQIETNAANIITNPDYFVTAQAIMDFLGNTLTISQDVSQSPQNEGDYNVTTQTLNYNGQSDSQLSLQLITANDIRALFE